VLKYILTKLLILFLSYHYLRLANVPMLD